MGEAFEHYWIKINESYALAALTWGGARAIVQVEYQGPQRWTLMRLLTACCGGSSLVEQEVNSCEECERVLPHFIPPRRIAVTSRRVFSGETVWNSELDTLVLPWLEDSSEDVLSAILSLSHFRDLGLQLDADVSKMQEMDLDERLELVKHWDALPLWVMRYLDIHRREFD